MITSAGKTWIARRIANAGPIERAIIAIGISNTPPDPSQTTLGQEIASTAPLTPTLSGNDVIYSGQITIPSPGFVITEIGLFDSTKSILIARSTIAGVYFPSGIPAVVSVTLRVL
jgi:hypothetical protein